MSAAANASQTSDPVDDPSGDQQQDVKKSEVKLLKYVFRDIQISSDDEINSPIIKKHLNTVKTSIRKFAPTTYSLIESIKTSEEVLRMLKDNFDEVFYVFEAGKEIITSPNNPIFVCLKVEEILFNKEFIKKNKGSSLSAIRIGPLTFFYWETSTKKVNRILAYRIYLFKFVARSLLYIPKDNITSISQQVKRLETIITKLVDKHTFLDPTQDLVFLNRSIAIKNILYYHQGEESSIFDFITQVEQTNYTPYPCITNKLLLIINDGLLFREQEQDFRKKIQKFSEVFDVVKREEKQFFTSSRDAENVFQKVVSYIAGYCCIVREKSVVADNSSESYFRPFVQTELLEVFQIRPSEIEGFFKQLYFGLYLYLLTGGLIQGSWGKLIISGYNLIVIPSEDLASKVPNKDTSKLYLPDEKEKQKLKKICS